MENPSPTSTKKVKTDSNSSNDNQQKMVRYIQKLERDITAVNRKLYRHPAVDQIDFKRFTGKDVSGAYNLGMEDGFKLFKDYMKKVHPEGNWDVVDQSHAKDMLKD